MYGENVLLKRKIVGKKVKHAIISYLEHRFIIAITGNHFIMILFKFLFSKGFNLNIRSKFIKEIKNLTISLMLRETKNQSGIQ